jgi:hypothetical protein
MSVNASTRSMTIGATKKTHSSTSAGPRKRPKVTLPSLGARIGHGPASVAMITFLPSSLLSSITKSAAAWADSRPVSTP